MNIRQRIRTLVHGEMIIDEEGVEVETKGLKQMSLKYLPNSEPDILLFLSMIEHAGYEEDVDFIESDTFLVICKSIALNGAKVKVLIKKIWSEE